jgi:hypothetical protein
MNDVCYYDLALAQVGEGRASSRARVLWRRQPPLVAAPRPLARAAHAAALTISSAFKLLPAGPFARNQSSGPSEPSDSEGCLHERDFTATARNRRWIQRFIAQLGGPINLILPCK